MGAQAGIEPSEDPKNAFDLEILSAAQPNIIPESDLKKLTRGPLKQLIQSPGNNEQIFRFWKCLLHTFSVPGISPGHRTAVCNAISSFLEFTLTSQDDELRQFALSEVTWFSVFDLVLDRYEDATPKPMKQVLGMLSKLLVEHPDPQILQSIRSRVVLLLVQTIILLQPRSRLKAALHSLQLFLERGALCAADIVALGQEWLWASHPRWSPLLEEHCINVDMPFEVLVNPEIRVKLPADEVSASAAQILCLSLLLNSRSQDRSLTAGALFCQFCSGLTFPQPKHPSAVKLAHSTPFWVAPLKHISLGLDTLDTFCNHVFRPLFRADVSHFRSFLGALPFEELQSDQGFDAADNEMSLLFSTLGVGKAIGLVEEDDQAQQSGFTDGKQGAVLLKNQMFRHLLVHPNPATRISALSLLVTDPSITKPLAPSTLSLLKETLPYVHTDNDPHSRGELLALLRKLVVRLRGRSNQTQQTPENEGNQESVSVYAKEFLLWYVDFLEGELHPCASYQTHTVALKALILVLQSGLDPGIDPMHLSKIGKDQRTWRFSLNLFRPSLFRAAGDLLIDSFDEVRASALLILQIFPKEILKSNSEFLKSDDPQRPLFSEFILGLSRAEDMASRSGRADYADSVARMYHILFDHGAIGASQNEGAHWYEHKYDIVDKLLRKLEGYLSSDDENLLTNLRNTPLHGHILALRYIVGTPKLHELISVPSEPVAAWRFFHQRIMALCDRIWVAVHPVLCVDSPEREQDSSNEETVGPKDILSCSWRALRESSLLLHAIILNVTYAPEHGQDGFEYEDFARIGKLSFTQLAELRHRGAFSTVAQTFTACSQRCGRSKDPRIAGLPEEWYKNILTIIDDQASKLTRRSAGIPALVTGVASSCLDSPLFQKIMGDLQNIAKPSTLQNTEGSSEKLPQVHALNSLKDMFTNTSLGPSTERYLMSSLNIAADCLGYQIWAIRNCGLMLFRALMTRMSRRTTGSRISLSSSAVLNDTPKISFLKYPELIPLLSRLLDNPGLKTIAEPSFEKELSISTERVFPALELISNKVSSASSEDDETLRRLVFSQTQNPIWGIRDHAARVYASLVSRADIFRTARDLSDVGSSIVSENQIHGRILCVRHLLQRLWASPQGYWCGFFDSSTASVIPRIFSGLGGVASSPDAKAALVEILNDAIDAAIRCNEEAVLLSHLTVPIDSFRGPLDRLLEFDPDSSSSRSSSLLLRALGHLIVGTHIIRNDATPEHLFCILHDVSKADPDAGYFILDRLQVTLRTHRPSHELRLRLYRRIIYGLMSARIQQVAISGLADILDSACNRGSSVPDGFDISLDHLSGASERGACHQEGNRELADATLHLQGCILPFMVKSSEDLKSPVVLSDLQKLISSVNFSMQEETEFTTRYSAARSMRSLLRGLKISGVHFHKTPSLLDALLVLYDMLNDDDDEVRDLAAETVSEILAGNSSTPRLPLAASVQLARYLLEHFPCSPDVLHGALRRFLGRTHATTIFVPVSHVFAESKQDDATLFAVEKQNLYIDDVREVQTWADILSQINCRETSHGLAQSFYSWVNDGLDTLADTVREEVKDGLLGWTSKADVYITGIRVIRGGEVLLRSRGFGWDGFDGLAIRRKLESLLETAEKSWLHEHWIFWIRSALNSDACRA